MSKLILENHSQLLDWLLVGGFTGSVRYGYVSRFQVGWRLGRLRSALTSLWKLWPVSSGRSDWSFHRLHSTCLIGQSSSFFLRVWIRLEGPEMKGARSAESFTSGQLTLTRYNSKDQKPTWQQYDFSYHPKDCHKLPRQQLILRKVRHTVDPLIS